MIWPTATPCQPVDKEGSSLWVLGFGVALHVHGIRLICRSASLWRFRSSSEVKVQSVRDPTRSPFGEHWPFQTPSPQPQTLSRVPVNWPTAMAAQKANRQPVGGGFVLCSSQQCLGLGLRAWAVSGTVLSGACTRCWAWVSRLVACDLGSRYVLRAFGCFNDCL